MRWKDWAVRKQVNWDFFWGARMFFSKDTSRDSGSSKETANRDDVEEINHLFKKTLAALPFDSDEERIRSFSSALNALAATTENEMGRQDIDHLKTTKVISQILEIIGRGLLHFSFEPFSYGVGVLSLSAHKSIELMELGHTILHGAYDKLSSEKNHHSNTFRWKAPIDEESWRRAHNVLHHRYTNIAGKDPDLDFGFLRLSAQIPHRLVHRLQPWSNLGTWSVFGLAIGLHASGMIAVYAPASRTKSNENLSWEKTKQAHQRFLRKAIPYYAKEFMLYPALAGPFCGKVWLGNLLSEWMRDMFSAAVIYCGHVGAEDSSAESRFHSRAEYYEAQVRRARNLRLHPLLSILAGGLDLQVEHHLFPHLPPNRLRALAPEVQRICEQHSVPYHSEAWIDRLVKVWRELASLRTNR